MDAVILAGGRAERMGELGLIRPKSLLYLPGGSLIDRLLDQLSRATPAQVSVVVDDPSSPVGSHLTSRGDVRLLVQEPPRTLFGALRTALGRTEGTLLIVHGDNVFSHGFDYFIPAAHASPAAFLTETDASTVAGCYLLSTGLFGLTEELTACDDLESLWPALAARGLPVQTIPLQGGRVNVNRSHDYLSAIRLLLDRPEGAPPLSPTQAVPPAVSAVRLHPPTWISPSATLTRSEIGPYAVIGDRALVEDSQIANAVVFPGCTVAGTEAHGVAAVDGRLIRLE